MANIHYNNVTDNVVSVRENEQQCAALPLLPERVVSAQAGVVAAARSHNAAATETRTVAPAAADSGEVNNQPVVIDLTGSESLPVSRVVVAEGMVPADR